jgi:hypothetical protein
VQHVEEIFGAVKAIEAALATLQPGDLVLLQADTVDETVDFVRRYLAAHQTAREVNLPEALATAPSAAPVLASVSAHKTIAASEPTVASVAGEAQPSVAAFAG